MKNILCYVLASGFAMVGHSQGIQFTQFNATPMMLSPAYTGIMNGTVRGNLLYRNQWGSVTAPFISAYASVDGRTKYLKNGDYMGMGGSFLYSEAGDGTLNNFSGLGSFAYHKSIGWKKKRPKSVALGVQGGYAQYSIDLTRLYFTHPSQYYPGMAISNTVRYWTLNAGASFSQSLNDRFNYIAGVGVYHITQPNDALSKAQAEIVGFRRLYTASTGANFLATERFSLRPAIIFTTDLEVHDYMLGNEFSLRLGRNKSRTYAFLGLWYRSGDAAMATLGIAKSTIRVTAAYDYSYSSLNSASNGNGGFEVSVTYLGLTKAARIRGPVECNRF